MLIVSDKINSLEVEKARILDFYLLFPAMLAKIKMPRQFNNVKKLALTFANEYHDPISPLATFRDMHHIQNAALKCLSAAEFIDNNLLEKGFLVRTEKEMPLDITVAGNKFLENKKQISDFIVEKLSQLPLSGHDGLKHRTELMEYRYDVA